LGKRAVFRGVELVFEPIGNFAAVERDWQIIANIVLIKVLVGFGLSL
jgi:hypothetical protein